MELSRGLLSMLRPRAFLSRAHAGFCHSSDRVSTSSTSCNDSQFKKHTSIKEKKNEKQRGKTRSHHSYQEIFNSISTSNKSLDSGEVPSIS